VLGVHPYKAPGKLIEAFTPLARQLSEELGTPVEISIAADYQQHIDAIGRDQIDIAYLGPASYVKLVEQYGKKPLLARQALRGIPTFHGKIIVRQDSPLHSLADLKGKAFAFGDPASTMSHLVPRYMLWEAGIDVENLSKHAFLGSHDNVALAVLAGDYDAGAVKEAVFHKYRSRGLRALATSPALSDHLFVASNRLSPHEVARIRQVLLNLGATADGIKVMYKIKRGITAMLSVSDEDYQNLRTMLSKLEELGVAE
jgi:phosphonate transport system substrate-binding protein